MKTSPIDFVTLGAQLGLLPPNHEKTDKIVEAVEIAHKAWLKTTVEARKAERERTAAMLTVLHGIFDEETNDKGEPLNVLPRNALAAVAVGRLPGVTVANYGDVEDAVLLALQGAPTLFQLRGGRGRGGITVYRVRTKSGKETGVTIPEAAAAPEETKHANGAAAAS